MPRLCYTPKNFADKTLLIIELANDIIEEYVAQGFVLTLRQLYYQFIGRDLFPPSWIDEAYNFKRGLPPDTKNTEKNYNRLGAIISAARLAGHIDWKHIVDRSRELKENSHWSSPSSIISSAAESFAIDKWADQKHRIEVWIEKEALMGVIENVCQENDVPYFACRGYNSLSAMWGAAQRLEQWVKKGQTPVIFHLGDHDPSGKDMTRDNADRLQLFLGGRIKVQRLALNMDQIIQFDPPPNPAKVTDSRAAAYIAEFGNQSWELDALEPAVMVDIIQRAILYVRDDIIWNDAVGREEEGRTLLDSVSESWTEVVDFLNEDN